MGLGPNGCQIGNSTCYVLKVSKFCVEKGYHVNRLESVIFACECVFYRPEHNSKRGLHGTELLRS